ncbi:glycosyltransferase family 4 protein [Achromobacter sp. Marseille-Q0513]|uniref:glycosyltransferase family 4 protein n=1 Tax=Achromobacter sp. Marseille-Q0513 TaxID=2829161 RepID=UPI001B98FA70|nr:glycosyltransferase family 1 protein [Achromobacter sp. Marseille-Q0513]MBR8652314.1 glycosyltransferase family 4 protein [Achromobacter sp. Marseille-Q0513]
MKIVINSLSSRMGGGQTYIKNLLARLPKNEDVEIYVYAPADLELPTGRNLTRLSPDVNLDNPLRRAFWEKIKLPRILKEMNADILFCPGGLLNTPVHDGCRTVTMFRNMVPFDDRVKRETPFGLQRIRSRILKPLMLKSMKKADLVIFISDYARSVIENYISVKRAVTIPHGISQHFLSHKKAGAEVTRICDEEYILYVSRFESYKCHMEVVKAYQLLPDHVRKQYKLLLVGENEGEFGDRVRNWIIDANLTDRIEMVGKVNYQNLPDVYRAAKLTLFASSCENCPNILLEALGAGRPIACSAIMPMPEFGGDAVVYFDPHDPKQIARSIVDILSDDALAQALSDKAIARSEMYDWATTARRTWDEILALGRAKG